MSRARSYQYLLDLDVDLAEEFDVRMRLVARPAATAFTFDADVGEVHLTPRLAAAGTRPRSPDPPGRALHFVNVRVGDRVAAELLGPGTWSSRPTVARRSCSPARSAGGALVPMRFALLDAPFAEQGTWPWPQLTQALLRRAELRAHNLNIQRAITSPAAA